MKVDVQALKTEIKTTAEACRNTKRALTEKNREWPKVAAMQIWQESTKHSMKIAELAGDLRVLRERMTALCVFRAHLRGRKHLTENSVFTDQVSSWIENLEAEFVIEEPVVG